MLGLAARRCPSLNCAFRRRVDMRWLHQADGGAVNSSSVASRFSCAPTAIRPSGSSATNSAYNSVRATTYE